MLHIDDLGRVRRRVDPEVVANMLFPVECKYCHHIHDSSKVIVLQRYSDCSVWACPNCKAKIDDRSPDWGGSAIPIERE